MCEEIRALPMTGMKPDPLSVTPPLHPGCTASSAGLDQLPEQMDVGIDSGNPKMKYTGRVRLCVARYSYNPYTGPNEHPEAELPLRAGKYLYVYGHMDEDGFYQGELMDGRRGLVPSNFVALLQDDDSHPQPEDTEVCRNLLLNSDADHPDPHMRGVEPLPDPRPAGPLPGQPQATAPSSAGALDVNIDEVGEDVVPYPRRITLIKQLGRSVIVGWDPAFVPPGRGAVLSYNVLVDKEVRVNVPAGGRTKALIEKLSLADFTYRVCVQSLTERGSSDELRCTLQVGKNVCVAPSHLKVESISQATAEISWQPSNSNYDHIVFLNEQEYDVVKAAGYKYTFYNLRPCTTCVVKVLARPHQVPWQLPLEQRERREATVEFCTLPTGPPAPPEDVSVQVGSAPGTLRISWKAPVLTCMGTSNGARVTGYSVCAKGQRVAEVKLPTAESVTVDYLRIQNLETREIIVRTVSAQGESEDSCAAPIPTELLGCQPWAPARARPSADQPAGPLLQREGPWGPPPAPPRHGPTLGPMATSYGHRGGTGRSPSPQRILPQPQGTPIPSTVAKAMAREAAQRVTERTKAERTSTFQQEISDEEEANYDAQGSKRPGGSVDDFLRHSELGRQHSGHGDNELSESSRGSDLSDILEEDEEELYSEMQLEEGGRRRHSTTPHTALKISCQSNSVGGPVMERPEASPLNSIPEQYEEAWQVEGPAARSWASDTEVARSRPERWQWPTTCGCPTCSADAPGRRGRAGSASCVADCPREVAAGSRRTGSLSRPVPGVPELPSPGRGGPDVAGHGAHIRRRASLQRQVSVEEDVFDEEASGGRATAVSDGASWRGPGHRAGNWKPRETREMVLGPKQLGRTTQIQTSNTSVPNAVTVCVHREKERLLMLGSNSGHARMSDRTNHSGRRTSHGSSGHRARPMTVPSIEITVDSNSEGGRSLSGSEGPISPSREETYYRHVTGRRRWPHQRTSVPEHRYDSHHGRERLSPEPRLSPEEQPTRIFVALFDYDPLSMSPNPDAAEELPFREGQIIQVHGTKDADGFYHGETGCRVGLIPCNMVSEIQADSEEMVEQLVKQGFLPLNTRVETIGVTATPERYKESTRSVNRRSRKTKRERNRRTSRTLPVPSRRMVALYDYDPRESSPNVDVEAELTFCAGDIISVWGELDEDGFYYGEINGHKGLVPSNFLEEVPDDVEVYLSDVPSRYPQEGPAQGKGKRVPGENTQRRATSPTAHAHHHSGSALVDGTGSPLCTRDMASKKKKGLLSKGKKLLRKLGGVK